jgi:hypothetical protein
MFSFRLQTEKTGNLPHLSYILRKPEPLGTEVKNGLCTHLQIVLSMTLCRAKNDAAPTEFDDSTQRKIPRITLNLMKRAKQNRSDEDEDDQNINQDATPDVFLGDAWFSSVELCLLAKRKLGVHYIGVVKTNSSRYPKAFLQNQMKHWPAGSHLLLKTTIEGDVLFALGYKYCNSKTLMFIFTDGAGHTQTGAPYVAKWRDDTGNPCTKPIARPSVISFYFKRCNGIDVHNQQRQKELRLEKCWVTTDGYFRICTSLFGMTVVDAWRGYLHHTRPTHCHFNMKLLDFVDCLVYDLLNNKLPLQPSLNDSHSLVNTPPPIHQVRVSLPPSAGSVYSDLSASSGRTQLNMTEGIVNNLLREMESHGLKTTEKREKDTRARDGFRLKRGICVFKDCNRKTSMYCPTCAVPHKQRFRDCFWVCGKHKEDHVQNISSSISERTTNTTP